MKVHELHQIVNTYGVEVNPLAAFVHQEFNRHDRPGVKLPDYRERAIDAALQSKLPFQSECNTLPVIARRYLRAVCPTCQDEFLEATPTGGSGCGPISVQAVEFKCKCGIRLTLTLLAEAVGISHPK